jgi:glycosyltransferase involved in cell wall biosynthesis
MDLEIWGDKKIILFVGNPIPGKRLDIFLKALAEINDESIVGLVVGGGYYIERYKKLAQELGLQKRVLFVGTIHKHERLAHYYNVAACLAVPSTAESFSLVVVEAMASGCPVVATDLPGVRERIVSGVDGFLVAPGSVDALVAGIHKVLSLTPHERGVLTARARAKMLERFSWRDHAEKIMAVYKELHL